jgi:hypothetical protein
MWTACNYGSNYESTETRCDGKDNDCDGQVDEGTGTALCGAVYGGTPYCASGGVCQIASCNVYYADYNGIFSDGCECQADSNDLQSRGTSCANAYDLGTFYRDTQSAFVQANILPSSDEDWYKTYLVNTTSTGTSGTQAHYYYHVDFDTTYSDPNTLFDVYKSSTNDCSNLIPIATGVHGNWYNWNNNTGDNTTEYYFIRVYRTVTPPTCSNAQYKMQVRNE